MKIRVEYDNKTYEANPLSWDDVDRIESVLNGFLLNLEENIAEASTKARKQSITRQLLKTKKEQRELVEDILTKYFNLKPEELVSLGFIGATVIFNRFYKKSTDLSDFLEMQSEPALQQASQQTTQSSSPSK